MKQYEEKNAPKLNHDITLEEIEAACRAHQKENDNRNMAEECRTIAREQKEKMQAQFTKGKGEKRHILLRLGRYLWQFKGWAVSCHLVKYKLKSAVASRSYVFWLCRRCDGWQGTGKYGACNLLL